MSLINDMLKDLDRDQSGDSPDGQPLPAGLTVSKAEDTQNLRRFLLPGFALLAIAYALLVEWNVLGILPEKKSTTVVAPEPIALNSKWLKQQGQTESATAAQSTAAAAIGIEQPVTPANQTEKITVNTSAVTDINNTPTSAFVPASVPAGERESAQGERQSAETSIRNTETTDGSAMQQLLQAGARALAANRLTTPVGDNAYHFYKSVLVIDPDNTSARAGIASVQQRYIEWLDNALNENRMAAAQLYWQKARSVGVDSATLTTYQTALSQNAPSQAALPQSPVNTESVKASTVAAVPVIKRASVPSDEELATRLHQDGSRREQDALRLLAQMPSAQQTAIALADLYIEGKAADELRRLHHILQGQPAQHYVMAQLYVLEGKDQHALNSLAGTELQGRAEQQRLRLFAGLQQKAGHYNEAMQIYANLVSSSPNNVGDWLGLAVSADKGKFNGTALNAYEKVLLLRHPDQRVMRFARQRQQDLSLAAINHR